MSTEDVRNGVVHWVIEKGGKGSLVRSNICGISIEVLAHLEDASSLTILTPEVHGDLRDSIDTDSIEAIVVDKIVNPVLEVATHVVVVLVEIRKACESAVLD